MSWLKFSVAVVVTSAALVVGVFATGAFVISNALASASPVAAAEMGGGHRFDTGNLPPELAGLKDVPAAERFAHFKGVQVALTDKDGKPVQIAVVPGVASAVDANSVTITGNDGATHTYSVNDQTMKRGDMINSGDNVVVVTMNDTTTARAIVDATGAEWHH